MMKFPILLSIALVTSIPLHAATTEPAEGRLFPPPQGEPQPRRIVWVLDSRNGAGLDSWPSFARQLDSAVGELVGAQSFDVIAVADEPRLFSKSLVPASDRSRAELHRWMKEAPKQGGTYNALKAFDAAFALKPDLLYFATFADLPTDASVMNRIEVLNREGGVRVMTSAAYWGDRKPSERDVQVLSRIALENRGDYSAVRLRELEPKRIGDSIFATLGPQSDAKRMVFVCDASGSMLNKFSTLRGELSKAVGALTPDQSFDLIFMQEQSCHRLFPEMVPATPEKKKKTTTLVEDTVTPRGETNPIPAIEAAFALKPDLVFLLTDGDFPDNDAVLRRIAELDQTHAVAVNTIAFVSKADTDTAFYKVLQKIAHDHKGIYVRVNEEDLSN